MIRVDNSDQDRLLGKDREIAGTEPGLYHAERRLTQAGFM